ncbi:hypothetical protein [Serratia quinivorans]|uniref:hypothetical protein n=1 Tax=Serratia quinivorans TaxID=137545 RepID=UPI002178D0A2|nr:hypothetical protein [Serratia quinivorans]CAI1010309.1 pathogenicity island 2 effector protein SseE [Serratia quinivorans]CAI1810706.1 pathogenicity island 2 effector protein SseE [Serratia quinivorans]
MNPQPDAVSRYLQQQGYSVRPVRFQHTAYWLGWEVTTAQFSMTYRLDGSILLICDIRALTVHHGLGSAMRQLMALWQRLLLSIAAVNEIRGMVGSFGGEVIQPLRNKMLVLLIRHGARLVEQQQQRWLIYTRHI